MKRNARGGYDLRLPSEERQLLRALPVRLKEALGQVETGGGEVPESVRRLFPPAYLQDEEAERAYREMAIGELVEHHLEALTVLTRTADATRLTDEEADAWLTALNDLRLSIGTALGVTEEHVDVEPDDPTYSDWICYQYLSYLQSEAIEAMYGALPPPSAGADEVLPEDPWGEPPGGLRWDGTPRPDTR